MSGFHNAEHESLARKAVDGSRVLDGEDLESTEFDDAVHWHRVYGELIAFKERLLSDMAQGLPQLPEEAAGEVKTVDMAITRQQLERYQIRRGFWKERLELNGERSKASL